MSLREVFMCVKLVKFSIDKTWASSILIPMTLCMLLLICVMAMISIV